MALKKNCHYSLIYKNKAIMTLQQLEYIVAVDTHKSFVAAAESCFVTQPTLSMQVHKLEEGLGIKLFDRSKQPVVATEAGAHIIAQARKVLAEGARVTEIINEVKGIVSGEIRLGIIPTIAPYLLPLFMPRFLDDYPMVRLSITEHTTDGIISLLKTNQLDCGIMATPLDDATLKEIPLYYEPFVAYVSKNTLLYKKTTIEMSEIDAKDTWLLAEGHCMRSQVLQICLDRNSGIESNRLNYEAGSLETLRRIVETDRGMTILPQLSITEFNAKQQARLRYFKDPEPVREISIVTHRHFVKKSLIEALAEAVKAGVPEKMLVKGKKSLVELKR